MPRELKEERFLGREILRKGFPLIKDAAFITIQTIKEKHLRQVRELQVKVEDPMPDHRVLGLAGTYVVLILSKGQLHKMQLTDYAYNVTKNEPDDQARQLRADAVFKKGLTEMPQLFTV